MSSPYVGEIRMFGGNFAPAGWMFCEGQTLPISEYEVLFVLIGTTYGGDGQSTFALPDLRGRVPIHKGQGAGLSNYQMGQSSGTENVTLISSQIPSHQHSVMASTGLANRRNPKGALFATATEPVYAPGPAISTMASAQGSSSGGGQPHSNVQPFLCVNFIISLFGIFPTQN